MNYIYLIMILKMINKLIKKHIKLIKKNIEFIFSPIFYFDNIFNIFYK